MTWHYIDSSFHYLHNLFHVITAANGDSYQYLSSLMISGDKWTRSLVNRYNSTAVNYLYLITFRKCRKEYIGCCSYRCWSSISAWASGRSASPTSTPTFLGFQSTRSPSRQPTNILSQPTVARSGLSATITALSSRGTWQVWPSSPSRERSYNTSPANSPSGTPHSTRCSNCQTKCLSCRSPTSSTRNSTRERGMRRSLWALASFWFSMSHKTNRSSRRKFIRDFRTGMRSTWTNCWRWYLDFP